MGHDYGEETYDLYHKEWLEGHSHRKSISVEFHKHNWALRRIIDKSEG